MSEEPRVQRMVMFKHGVAYLERGGPAEGAFELSFRLQEMNDVLKSLAIWVAEGDAKVGPIGFEKPEDPDEALIRRKLAIVEGAALTGVLSALRGRRVAVTQGADRIEGEVLGVERVTDQDARMSRSLVLRTDASDLRIMDLGRITDVALLDPKSRDDLELFVDRSRAATAGENRVVRVALSGRATDLRVSYVIPAPVWRVSYRVAADREGILVMAFGIVHNPADEDLEDIELVLTTGQPVSFQIDLYHPKVVERTTVEEESRQAAAPTRFERGRAAPPPPPAMAFGPPGYAPPPQPAAAPAPRMMAMAMPEESAADYADRGELFEYRLSDKVSLKRGGSAMVPLFTKRVPARKERIWRVGAQPSPDLVVTFENTTGAVLEEGPAVIYDESVYAGESMVPYSARNVPVRLGFAKDLAVRCKHGSKQTWVATSVRLADSMLIEQSYREERHELVAESDHEEPVEVVFELAKMHGRSIEESFAKPFEETLGYRRFRAEVPAHGKVALEVVERWPDSRNINYRNVEESVLEFWRSCRFLDDTTLAKLRAVRAAWAKGDEKDRERAQVEAEMRAIYEKQTKLSEQLNVLKDGGKEGDLRLRYVRELSEAQDGVNRCEAEIRRLVKEAEEAREEGKRLLGALTA